MEASQNGVSTRGSDPALKSPASVSRNRIERAGASRCAALGGIPPGGPVGLARHDRFHMTQPSSPRPPAANASASQTPRPPAPTPAPRPGTGPAPSTATRPAAPGSPIGANPAAPAKAAPAQQGGTSGLSIAQMLRVMRVEFQRAGVQRQPLCCLMVAIDGIADMQKRGGFSLKQMAMRTAYEHLKTVARERQCFGMSLLSGDRIMAIFPGASPSRLSEFGNALVEHARKNPIRYTGLYRDELPPEKKPAAEAKPTSTDPSVADDQGAAKHAAEAAKSERAGDSATVDAKKADASATDSRKSEASGDSSTTEPAEQHHGESHEITFDDHPDERLKSREAVLEAEAATKEAVAKDAAKKDDPKGPLPATASETTAEKAVERPKRKPGEPVEVKLTLSLGASHNLLAETSSSFEGLVEKAGRALQTAREANGDRYVMWREAEAEIAGLRDDLAAQRASFRQEEALLREEASEVGGLQQAALVDRIQSIFAKVPRTPELEAVEKEVIALAVAELYEGRQKAIEAQMAEHARLVDQLERRIAKLTSLLGVTEEELQRVLSMKTIDEGVASIYRTVQGLGADAAQAEQKKAMMAVIFNENLAFQKRNDASGAEPAKAA